MSREARQRAIADLMAREALGSQEEVTTRLGEMGYAVTQATVSRDLDQIGAIKVRRGGRVVYALPGEAESGDWSVARLDRIIAEWVRSVEAAGNMLVLKTPPGSAHQVALAVDQAHLPEVAGTVSGDDTLFVVLRDGVSAGMMVARFSG